MADIAGALSRFSLTTEPQPADQSEWQMRAFRLLAVIAVIGGLTFNAFLCFVNTRIFTVHDSLVMLGELIFIGSAMIVAADRKIGLYLGFGLFVAYMFLLFALRHQIDPKPIRDIMIPFAFYFAGVRLADQRLADMLVTLAVVIVLIDGMFEYASVETYLDYFNVIGYYLARGTVKLEETFGQTRGLFISGLRPEPRTILPFLGQHRVSSVFLEPVSAGNFGVIVYAWTLYSRNMRWRWLTMAGALAVIALGDARFGLYSIVLITLLYPFYQLIPRPVWFAIPFLALAGLAIYGIETATQGGGDDIGGRLKVTAHLLTMLDDGVVFGSEVTDQFTSDSGLAYTLTQFGIFGFIGLWGAFVYAQGKTARAWTFQSMAIVYFLLLLVISNSGYSIKTAGLLWFILGSANAALPDKDGKADGDQRSLQDLSSNPGRSSALS
jgi:putative polymerase